MIAQYKETFSILSQATKMIAAEHGGSLNPKIWNNSEEMYNAYLRYLKVSKTCENQQAFGSCFSDNYKYLMGADDLLQYMDIDRYTYSLTLSNGVSLVFHNYYNSTYSIWIDTMAPKVLMCLEKISIALALILMGL